MNKKDQKNAIWGGLFGFIAPLLGLFLGLQVIPLLGTVLMFPFLAIGIIVDLPFGEFGTSLIIIAFLASILIWALDFLLIGRLRKSFNRS